MATIPHVEEEQLIQSAWGNAVADGINALQTGLPGDYTALSRGTLGLARITASQANITSGDITGMAVNIPGMLGRRIRASALVNFYGVGSFVAQIAIYLNNVQAAQWKVPVRSSDFFCAAPVGIIDGIAGAMNFKVVVTGGSGANVVNVEPGGTPNYLLIEDIGRV
jgi:hypothetical protein